MKKLLGFVVLCFFWFNSVQAQSLITINKYLKDNVNSLEDPITLTYLMNRCSAAYIFASVVTNKTMPDAAEISEIFLKFNIDLMIILNLISRLNFI